LYPLIHIAPDFEIPTFFLVISLVLSAGLFWIVERAKAYRLPQKNILDLSLILMAASLVGARLFHVFYENPEHYAPAPEKVFYLWEGGFVFFGGAFTAFLAALAYLHFRKIEQGGDYFDAFAPVLAFTYGAGRIGCFLAGCCYGGYCDVPWAVNGRHPTQLYATFWELGTLLLLLGCEKKGLFKRPGNLFILWVALHAVGRMMMESFRDDFRGAQLFGLSVSTVICIGLLGISLVLLGLRRPYSRR
jgi:phosphatidylglycerol:prolipoprotein diacylglycerol transferase